MDISRDQQAALGWQAYLYASDQMSPAEREAFEERLDSDQQTREMVAQVVQLTHTLGALPAEAFEPRVESPSAAVEGERRVLPAGLSNSHWRQPAGWMAVGAAACWLLLMAWSAVDRSGNSSRSDSSSRPVVLAWTEYAGQPNDSVDEIESDAADDRTTRPSEVASDVEPDLAAPDWLVSAINLADESAAAPAEGPANDVQPVHVPGPGAQPTDDLESTDVFKSAAEK